MENEVQAIKLGNNGGGPLIVATKTKYGWTKPATVIQNDDGEFQLTGLIDLIDHYGECTFPEVLFTAAPSASLKEAYERFFTEIIKPE